MKTEKEIREKYKDFEGNNIAEFYKNNNGPRPMTEYSMYGDYGWKAALKWVLDISDVDN